MIPIPPRLALWVEEHGRTTLKYVLGVLLFIAYSLVCFEWGSSHCEKKHAEQEAKAVIKAAADLKKEVNERLPVIEDKANKRAVLDSNVNKGKKRYEEAVDRSAVKPTCDLSPDELSELKALLHSQDH